MRLERLQLCATKVTDISPLRGMPLTSLRFHACPDLTDLSPLMESKELTTLTLPPKARNFEFLRPFPKLERLSFKEDQAQNARQNCGGVLGGVRREEKGRAGISHDHESAWNRIAERVGIETGTPGSVGE